MAFYWRSGGGLTVTGGEPGLQDEFASSLLKAAKDLHIDTAVETCGCVSWAKLERLLPHTDTFLYDIKHIDSEAHEALTGKPNELILENARRIAQDPGTELILRTPIIPGKNDDREHLLALARFAAELDVSQWDLLPYHQFGEGKYERLGREYRLGHIQPPDEKRMREIQLLVKPIFSRVEIENQ
jgi:pyruvate formate lyase activating enzyme